METTPLQTEQLTLEKLVDMVREIVNSESFLNMARKTDTAFTRVRKLPMMTLFYIMSNMVKTSTQTALNRFFELIGKPENTPTQQAFSKARQQFSWKALRMLLTQMVSFIYSFPPKKTWRDHIVLGVDGSKIQLPASDKLKDHFGTVGRNNTAPTAQGSILFDVLNGISLHALLAPILTGERALAIKHIDFLSQRCFDKAIVLFDRGYASFNLFKHCLKMNTTFLMRLRTKFDKGIDKLPCGIHKYKLERYGEVIVLQVVKFRLESGELETLVTNLHDYSVTIDEFKKLYFMRWAIETQYAVLKRKLEVENFSTRTVEGIYQEFYISVYLFNIVAVCAMDVQMRIDKEEERIDKEQAQNRKRKKHKYKPNFNHIIGVLKNRLMLALAEKDEKKRVNRYKTISDMAMQKLIPDRPNRSYPRNPCPRKCNFHFNQKSNC